MSNQSRNGLSNLHSSAARACDQRAFAYEVLFYWQRAKDQSVQTVAQHFELSETDFRGFFPFIENLSCDALREHLEAQGCEHLWHLIAL